MNFDFTLVLILLTCFSFIMIIADRWLLAGYSVTQTRIYQQINDLCHSIFPVIIIVFLLRSFLFEPFRIPSSSLEPSLLTGDFILVNKFQYGLHLPLTHYELIPFSQPEIGDVIVFHYPKNPRVNYIKRLIAKPGDRVAYQNKILSVNGKAYSQRFINEEVQEDNGIAFPLEKRVETIGNRSHYIYVHPELVSNDFILTVPEGQYFMMGDNRDNSSDSRDWGFVPADHLVGKAVVVWMSWDINRDEIRWKRLFSQVN